MKNYSGLCIQRGNFSSSLEHVKNFSNLLSEPIIVLDSDGYILFKNSAFGSKINNKSLSALSDENLSELIAQCFGFSLGSLSKTFSSSGYIKASKSKHCDLDAYLILNFESGIHQVLIKPIDSDELLQQVLNSIPSRVFWKDINSRFLGGNKLFLEDLKCNDASKIIGLGDEDLFPREQAKAFQADDREVIATGQPKINIEEPITHVTGKNSWLLTNKVPIRDRENRIVGVMGSYTDITEKKNHEQELVKLANTDILTGLPNRNGLSIFLQQLRNNQNQSSACLLFIDLNGFKQINDTLGHQTGDELLQSVSRRIQEDNNDIAFCARLGGDEFAVITYSNNENKAVDIAQSLIQILSLPFNINNQCINISASIGITLLDFALETWESAYHKADLAMYEAKAQGRSSFVIYNESLSVKYDKIIKLRRLINSALDNQELFFNIQPQFDETNQLISAEVLLRWHNEELGNISPIEFIPIAEESGAIISIGTWVIEKTFYLLDTWQKQLPSANLPPLAINISPKQFEQENFVDIFIKHFNKYSIKPELISLELTESILIEDREIAIKKINALHELGISIEIDDFGTGYSSLSYLSQLPIDKIKIDRSFISDSIGNHRKTMVLEGLINIGDSLNISVLAEGVESEQQKLFLIDRGCKQYQGFLFSQPIKEEAFFQQFIESC